MKQHAKDFRVRAGADINLNKWPTVVQPYYDSKKLGDRDRTAPALGFGERHFKKRSCPLKRSELR